MAHVPLADRKNDAPSDCWTRRVAITDTALCYEIAVEQVADTSVESLDFSDLHGLCDLPPALAGCSYLRRLNLANTAVSELNVLALMGELRFLNLWRCPVKDLAPLSGCSSLEGLNVAHSAVDDLSPLSGLQRLTYLDISGTGVTDLGPLSGLRRLRELILRGAAVTSLDALSELRDLQLVDLAQTPAAAVPAHLPKSRWAHVILR